MYVNLLDLFSGTDTTKVRIVCRMTGLFLLFAMSTVWADDSGKFLLEQDAVRIGLERPEITKQIQSRADLAESDIIAARTWANPEFSYDQETMDDGPKDINERSYMLSQEFSISGKRAIQIESARQRLKAAFSEIAQWRLEKTTEIRQKFYQVLYQQQLLDIYAQMRSAMDSLEKMMQERKKAGDISGYDLDRLKQERSMLLADQQNTKAEKARLTHDFFTAIGLSADQVNQWSGVKGSLFPQAPSRDLANLLEQAETQSDLMAMKLNIDAFETDERYAKRSWIPDLTLGVGYKDTDESDADAILFGVSMPIPVFDRNVAGQQKALANRQYLQNEYALTLAKKKGTIRGLWHQYNELAVALELLDCDECSALLETAKLAYQAGEIGVLEILDAHRSAFEHQVQLLDLMKAARMVRIDLELNTGGIIQ